MGSTVANGGLEALVCPQRGTGVPDGCLGANGKEPLPACLLLWVPDNLEIIHVSVSFLAKHQEKS